MAFRVGQKVVLVGWGRDHKKIEDWRKLGAVYPNVGDIYTVRAIEPWRDSAILLLVEIRNDHLGYSREPGIRQDYYRPVVERKTDIHVFTALLTPSKVEA